MTSNYTTCVPQKVMCENLHFILSSIAQKNKAIRVTHDLFKIVRPVAIYCYFFTEQKCDQIGTIYKRKKWSQFGLYALALGLWFWALAFGLGFGLWVWTLALGFWKNVQV